MLEGEDAIFKPCLRNGLRTRSASLVTKGRYPNVFNAVSLALACAGRPPFPELVASKLVPGLHFYCLNASERTYQIMERLGYLRPS